MPRGEIKNKKEYVDWICRIRRESHLNQEEFGSRILRFCSGKSEGRMYSCYGRGAVAHWEKGTHLPVNRETVISIALMDYANHHPEQDFSAGQAVNPRFRNERLTYVAACVRKYLNRGLYCKNLGDVLVFQAIRGLFFLEEVPALEEWIHKEIFSGSRKYSPQKIREYSRKRDTGMLYNQLLEIQDKEAFIQVLKEKRDFYSIGYRVVGERMKAEYETGYMADTGLDFQRAIRFYAPVYRDSYQHLFSADIRVSRRWLIDLCLGLHFSRESINSVLANAQYARLSDHPDNPESWICSKKQAPCGSVSWYEDVENQYLVWKEEHGNLEEIRADGALESDFEPYRFWRVREYSMRERLIYALALSCYEEAYGELPLPVYLLDFVLARKDTEELLKNLSGCRYRNQWESSLNQWRKNRSGLCRELCNLIRDALDELTVFAAPGEPEEKLILLFNEEYRTYYEIPQEKLQGWSGGILSGGQILSGRIQDADRSAFCRQHVFAAVLYSLVTGFLYKERVNGKECEELKQLDENFPEAGTFIRYIWRLYLGTEPAVTCGKGSFRINRKKGAAPELNLEKIMGVLVEILESGELECSK